VVGFFRGNGHRSPDKQSIILQRELRSAAAWQADVATATETIRNGQLEKVVLARAVELQATTPFDAARALRYLTEQYTGCYTFAMARGDKCFLGATPERLIRLQNGEVLTMSLAGSIRRGATDVEDRQLGQALMDSAKNRFEHTVVVQAMVEALDEVCTALQVSPHPALLKLGNIQHLCTTITGQLAHGETVFNVVEALNPTPAVGGRPRDASLQFIRDYEKLDRGWYAGPVGWVDAGGDGEFAVALRSALLHGHVATLFAGCGIMADSNPEHEYAESILKLKPMLAALGL
jgi:isochorismate synthase